ncbi:MAG: protein kinase, partial [Chloroflexota bacterium]
MPVAIKVLKRDLTQNDPELVRRFQLEGQTLRQLNHPNIVKMLGAEEQNGTNYLIMEYVQGGSLRDVLEQTPQFSVQRALYVALDLADALTRAHRLDVLHRDIKPGNVLVADDGTPRLTDFGMARVSGEPQITQDGAIVGTLAYLPPEVFQGDDADQSTDIWAFGVLLWEMLVGQRPFPQTQTAPLVQAIVTEKIPDLESLRPDAPTALVDLIYRMLDKNRQSRIPSVRLIGAELEAIIRGGSTTLQPVVSISDSTGRFDLETTEFPPATGNTFVAPNNLQHQPTPFVGREEELHTIKDLMTEGASLINLTGPGGTGKSRLSVAVAEKELSHYEDGVYVVYLENASANTVATSIAEAIEFELAGGDPQAELIDHLSEKHMLLVLDNFETVMDAAGFVSDLIANAPNICVIVTSRERLRLRGEQVVDVDSMRLPAESETSLEKLLSYPVVQLFVQSAKRALPGFELEEADAPYVGQIVRLVGGLPLGVELAAGWVEMLPLDEIVTEIENSLDFLETDLRDVPERHRSLRAVADYSWNLLSEDERDIFLKLGLFKGGFEREAAQKIAGASLRNLTTLVNKSLLIREPGGRYRLHKLLRQYAEDRFKEHPASMDTHMAFADYFVKLATKLGDVLNSSKEQAAFEALDKEIDNVRFVWHMGMKYKKFDKIGSLIKVFYTYYLGRSLIRDGEKIFCDLAEAMESEGRK